MDEKGTQSPSKKLKESKREPSGVSVLPGNYTTVLSYGDQVSKTRITIENDPRITRNQEASLEIYEVLKEMEDLKKVTANAVKQLAESKKIVSKFLDRLTEKNKGDYAENVEKCNKIKEKIDAILALYFGKEDTRQGITNTPEVSVIDRYRTANYYIGTRQNGMTETEHILLKQAKEALSEALKSTNLFFETEWVDFKLKMENIEFTDFETIKTFKINK